MHAMGQSMAVSSARRLSQSHLQLLMAVHRWCEASLLKVISVPISVAQLKFAILRSPMGISALQ